MAVKLIFSYSNHIVKYEAYAMGMQAALEMKVKYLIAYGDSILVLNQMRDEW